MNSHLDKKNQTILASLNIAFISTVVQYFTQDTTKLWRKKVSSSENLMAHPTVQQNLFPKF